MPLKLCKRKGQPNWYVRGSVKGHGVYESTCTSDRTRAEKYLEKKEAEIYAVAVLGQKPRRSFSQALVAYLEARGGQLSPSSIRYYRSLLFHFQDELVDSIDQDAIEAYVRRNYPDTAASTINRSVIGPMAAVLRAAARRKWCDVPMLDRRKEKPTKARALDYEEARALLTVCREDFRSLLSFMLNTGCRVGEALTLRWYAVDLTDRTVTFGKTDQDRTKNDRTRVVPLNRLAFADLVFTPHREGTVFLNSKGQAYAHREDGGGAISKPFTTALKAAGVDHCRVHDLRHTTASWIARAGHRSSAIAEILGHKRPGVTSRYEHLDIEHLRDVVESIVGGQVHGRSQKGRLR